MHTKFHNWGSRELSDSHWRWIVTAGVRTESSKEKRDFLKWMKKEFGEPNNRWSIRWSVLGVDIRFHEPKDYFKFTMFYTIDPEFNNELQ